jgi:SOS-response transcriptional repressor LexA
MTTSAEYAQRNKRVLKYIGWYWERYGFSPSYRSIGKAIGVASTSTVYGIIKHLEQNGHIQRNPVNHTIRLLNTGDPETCRHDWRVRKVANPLKIECADCGRKTEVEYDPPKDCPLTDLLKYTGKV